MTKPNHYSVLGVSHEASYQQIKTAYNRLVLQAHPDKGGPQSMFIQIQAAWEVLRDDSSRAIYNKENPYATRQSAQKHRHAKPKPAFPNNRSSGSDYSSMPGGYYSQPAGGNTRFDTKPDGNAWTSFRESSAGSAYNSYYGYSTVNTEQGSPRPRSANTSKPKPEDTSPKQDHPSRKNAHEAEDVPKTDPSNPEGTSHQQPRHARPTSHEFNAGAKPEEPPFRPAFRGSWSPPPVTPTELDVPSVKNLADQASRNLELYKQYLEHVRTYLQNREWKLKLRVYEVKAYNADVRAKRPSTPLESFFPTLDEEILEKDKDDVSNLGGLMTPVLRDTSEMIRLKRILEGKGMRLSDEDKVCKNLRDSLEALERVVTKIILSAPGVM